MYSEHIANAGSLPLLEGLALSQLPRILSKSFQVIALGGEHLGSARGENVRMRREMMGREEERGWVGRRGQEGGNGVGTKKKGDRGGEGEGEGREEEENFKVRKEVKDVYTQRAHTYTRPLTSERCLVSRSTLSHTLLVCSTPTAFSWPRTAISWGRTVATISPVPTLTRE